MEDETYGAETQCSWCGGDLSDIMEVERLSFDAALEAHVEECDNYLMEQHGLDGL